MKRPRLFPGRCTCRNHASQKLPEAISRPKRIEGIVGLQALDSLRTAEIAGFLGFHQHAEGKSTARFGEHSPVDRSAGARDERRRAAHISLGRVVVISYRLGMLSDQLFLDLTGGPAGFFRLARLPDRVGGDAQTPERPAQVVTIIRVGRMFADQRR